MIKDIFKEKKTTLSFEVFPPKKRVGFFSLKMSLIMFFLTSAAVNRSHFLSRCGPDGRNRSCCVRLRKGHRMLTHVE